MADPFQLFPEEVWEKIAGWLTSSRDILSLFQAFPKLDGTVLKNKCWWLMEQTIPLLHPWLKREGLLACRQVCRRWRLGVDTYFENNPDKRAPSVWRTVKCHGSFFCNDRFCWHVKYQGQGLYEFRDSEMIYEFTQAFLTGCEYPHGRNPFIGRSIHVIFDHTRYRAFRFRPLLELGSLQDEVLEFLHKFGGHIWLFSFSCFYMDWHPHSLKFMVDCLALLPNLKSLKILIRHYGRVDIVCGVTDDALKSFQKSIPRFPSLESLNLDAKCMSPVITHSLIRSYSAQIKTLTVRFSESKSRITCSLPNLRELNMSKATSLEEVTALMMSLKAPKLEKLQMELEMGRVDALMSMKNVVMFLHKFPLINCLVMVHSHFSGDWGITRKSGAEVHPTYCFPENIASVKSLEIRGRYPEQSLDLLKRFPNLEYLKIVADHYWMESKCRVYAMGKPSKLCQRIYRPTVWELLPKLRKITMESREQIGSRHIRISYTRSPI